MLTVLIEDRDGLTGCRQLSGLRAQTHESSLPHRDGRRQGTWELALPRGTGTRCRERVLKESNRQGLSLSFQRIIWVFDFDIVKNLDTFPSPLNWLFTDREAWCAAIHGVAKSRTQLSH